MENQIIQLLDHPKAPIFKRPDAPLIFAQVLSEVMGGNWSTVNIEFRELLRQASFVSLHFFLTVVAGYNGPYTKLTNHIHVDMANFYQRCMEPGTWSAGFVPRSFFKSSLWTHGANGWELLRDPDLEIGLGSAVVDRSIEFLRYTQSIFAENEFFAWLFPEVHVANPRGIKGWNDQELILPSKTRDFNRVNIQVISVGRSTAGIHVDLLKLDDIVSEAMLKNDRAAGTDMEGVRNWVNMSLPTLVKEYKQSRINVSGTRYAISDPYEGMMADCREAWGNWAGTRYATKPTGKWVVYYRRAIEDGLETFPENVPLEMLNALREKDPWTFYTQYMNDPLIEGMAEFATYQLNDCSFDYDEARSDWVISFLGGDSITEEVWLSGCDILIVLDPAATESRTSARTSRSALLFYVTDVRGRKFLLDAFVDYAAPTIVIDKLFSFVTLYGRWLRGAVVEQNGPFRFLEDLFYQEMGRRGVNFGLIRVQANSNKEARIRTKLQPILDRGVVYATKKVKPILIEELVGFPGGSRMDALDAWAWGESESRPPIGAEVDEQEYNWYPEDDLGDRSKTTGY